MTNEQLNQMSITELRELNSRCIAYIKLKNEIANKENAGKIAAGMTVRINTNNPELIGSTFILQKINKKFAVCKDINTNKTWNVLICNVFEKTEAA
jgi:hypothetical protein